MNIVMVSLFFSCGESHSYFYKNTKNTSSIQMVVKPNTLGYARVRGKSSFSVKDTSNVIAHIPCGTKIKVDIPTEFLKGGKRQDVSPWYYKVTLKNDEGFDTTGYILDEVLQTYEAFRSDSTCKANQLDVSEKMYSGRLVLKGNYNGKNLYVQNPYCDCEGFCITNVSVNGGFSTETYESSAFEIDLSKRGIKIGDVVEVVIEHKYSCIPKVLNPEVIGPRSTYSLISLNVTSTNLLTWTTENENGSLPFSIQQYIWDKWVEVGVVDGIGTPGKNKYEFQLSPHSGENRVRIMQTDFSGRICHVPSKTYTDASIKPVEITPTLIGDKINFSAKTRFELYDADGNILMKGFDQYVDCAKLKKGKYYMNYDSKRSEFVKK